MRLLRHRILIILFSLSCMLAGFHTSKAADRVTNRMSDTAWQRLTNDKSFSYKNDREETHPVKKDGQGAWAVIIAGILTFFSSIAGRIILWLLIISVIGYVIYIVIRDRTSIFLRRKAVLESQNEMPEDETDIINTNWETLLETAKAQNDMKLAIRYSYMLLLQLLQEHNLISYRSDKTNNDYYNELNGTAYRQLYRQLARQYEYTWYGNYEPTTDAYNAYMQAFNNIKQQLKQS